jgi:hypothetical protein
MSSIIDKLSEMEKAADRVEQLRKPRWSEAWDRYFIAALTSMCANPDVVSVKDAAAFAANMADAALEIRKEKFE